MKCLQSTLQDLPVDLQDQDPARVFFPLLKHLGLKTDCIERTSLIGALAKYENWSCLASFEVQNLLLDSKSSLETFVPGR